MTHTHADGHPHSHHGGLHVHGQTEGPMLWLCLLITLAFVMGEAISGYLAHSLALLADAGHNFGDAFALALAAYAIWIAKRPSSPSKTYGYHRVSILTALFNAATLLLIAVVIAVEAFTLFRHPEPVQGTLMMWVASVSVFMNTVIALLLRRGAKESLNLRAAYVHMAGDALSAVGVVAAGWIVKSTGWVYADPSVSVLIAFFIGWSSLGVVKDALNILLEGTPKGLDIDEMIFAMKSVGHVQAVHDIHVWTVSHRLNCLSAHVEVSDTRTVEECGAVVRDLNEILARRFNIHATLQTESASACGAHTRRNPLHCEDLTKGHSHVHTH